MAQGVVVAVQLDVFVRQVTAEVDVVARVLLYGVGGKGLLEVVDGEQVLLLHLVGGADDPVHLEGGGVAFVADELGLAQAFVGLAEGGALQAQQGVGVVGGLGRTKGGGTVAGGKA